MYIRGYVEVEVTEDTEDVLVELRQAVARPVIASIELNNDEYPKPARSLATLIERAESCLKVTFLDVIDKTLTIYKEAVYAN